MHFKNKKILGILEVLLSGMFLGVMPIFVRSLGEVGLVGMIFFRALFGGLCIYVLLKISGKNIVPFKKDKLMMIFWAVLLSLSTAAYFTSLKIIPVSSAVLLLYSYAVLITLFSGIFLREKISVHTIIASVLSVAGILLILPFESVQAGNSYFGYICALAAAIFGAIHFLIPKKYLKSYDAYSLTFYQTILQLPLLGVFLFFYPPILTFHSLILLALFGLICTTLAFFLFYDGLRRIPGQYAGILHTTEIPVSILLALFFFGEIPSVKVILGGGLLVLGYVLIGVKEMKINEK